jgi:hypothetical protein
MSLYSIYGGYSLAYNALSWADAQRQISLAYHLPTSGEYTLSIRDNALIESVLHVYLTDHDENVVVDLLECEYQFMSQVKESDKRFTIQIIRKIENTDPTTDIGNIDLQNDHTQKIYHQGQLFILHRGKIYNIIGQHVTNK